MYDIVFYKGALETSLKLGWKGVMEISGKNAVLHTKKGSEEIKIKILPGNRKNSEKLKNSFLKDFELEPKKDSVHYPRSGMDQIIAKFMQQNNNTYCFPLDLILADHQKMRRVGFNMLLANKYKFPIILASFAKKKEDQRAPDLIRALAQDLGLREDLAKKSLKTFK